MKKYKTQVENEFSNSSVRFRATGVAMGVAAALTMAQSTTSFAQEDIAADNVELDEIVVKGYRRSLQNSFALKEESQQIIEVVTAEDIGKLPDVSIAESLARLPVWLLSVLMAVARLFRFVVCHQIFQPHCSTAESKFLLVITAV